MTSVLEGLRQRAWAAALFTAALLCGPASARADAIADPTGEITGGAAKIETVVLGVLVLALAIVGWLFLRRVERAVREREISAKAGVTGGESDAV